MNYLLELPRHTVTLLGPMRCGKTITQVSHMAFLTCEERGNKRPILVLHDSTDHELRGTLIDMGVDLSKTHVQHIGSTTALSDPETFGTIFLAVSSVFKPVEQQYWLYNQPSLYVGSWLKRLVKLKQPFVSITSHLENNIEVDGVNLS